VVVQALPETPAPRAHEVEGVTAGTRVAGRCRREGTKGLWKCLRWGGGGVGVGGAGDGKEGGEGGG
jgi:hypothetical protein